MILLITLTIITALRSVQKELQEPSSNIRFWTLDIREICGDEIFTFQNIFELKKTKKPVIPQPKHKTNYRNIIVAIDKGRDLQSIKNSFSWKITAPLRKIYFFFRRNK